MRLLRRNVVKGSKRNAAGRKVVGGFVEFGGSGQPHVNQFGLACLSYQNVGRLDVAMDYFPLKCMLQRLCNLTC